MMMDGAGNITLKSNKTVVINATDEIIFKTKKITMMAENEVYIESKKLDGQKKIEQQLKEVNDQKFLPSSEIEIQVSSDTPVNTRFHITYLTTNAGWFPKYDARVKNIKSPLELTYKAEVHQNTGVDWKNVKLRFSNGQMTNVK